MNAEHPADPRDSARQTEDPPLRQLWPDDPGLAQALDLLRDSFAYMDGRIDPPSSLHAIDLPRFQDISRQSEIWAVGIPPHAMMILTPRTDRLYLGKFCIAPGQRGQGLARRMVDLARTRAQELGLPVIELQTRVELTENHRAFGALGFVETARTAHAGYDRATSITMQMPVSPA